MKLNQIRIVLMNTSHPGNIGAAARAMKTMGLSRLYLVQPECFPHAKAMEMAANATDILNSSIVVNTLDEAIANCHWVVGTSARLRTITWPNMNPREMAAHIFQEPDISEVAIVFGHEQSGLSNEELHRCHVHVQIPADANYSSLNLAAAVQVIAYEVYAASLQHVETQVWDYPLGNTEELESFYQHLEKVLIQLDFLNAKAPRQLMTRLRRLFTRTRLDTMELNILRGILGMIEKKTN